jgi:hypothetical protein
LRVLGIPGGASQKEREEAGASVAATALHDAEMPNHIHLIPEPPSAGALFAALGGLHRDFARQTNFRRELV